MKFAAVIPLYLWWHYTAALAGIVTLSGRFLWFIFHVFSVPLLFKTLFSPWRRLAEEREKGTFDPESFFASLVANMLMRILGFFVRLFTIGAAFFLSGALIIAAALFFVYWLLMPAFILAFIVWGIDLVTPF